MRTGFYSKLAIEGIRKNRQMYFPYLLTCIMVTAMFYILNFLAVDELISNMAGGGTTRVIMALGAIVIAVFAVLFLFYTQSFIIRRRKKEFGLYNVLGMNKGEIGRILIWETLITGGITLVLGIASGIALSKVAEMGLLRTIKMDVDYTFRIQGRPLVSTAILVLVVFLLIFINSLRQVRFSGAIDLVKSENAGEKPPKGNILIGLSGFIILGAAYYIALKVKNPIEALTWFFIAVIMVIVATYLLFISGSVVVLRFLKAKKGFYYKSKNFVAVSSMSYRMKRNGAGLASICILLTMILVMISSTSCLFIGEEDSLSARYPRNICTSVLNYGFENDTDRNYSETTSIIYQTIKETTANSGAERLNERTYSEYNLAGYYKGGVITTNTESYKNAETASINDIAEVHFVDLDDFNRIEGTDYNLKEGEALVCIKNLKGIHDKIQIDDISYSVNKILDKDEIHIYGADNLSIAGSIVVIAPNVTKDLEKLAGVTDESGRDILMWRWYCEFDINGDINEQEALSEEINTAVSEKSQEHKLVYARFYSESYEDAKSEFYEAFGGLFFLGIMLSIVFMLATVLMLYYKQISEGYEDQKRFQIMKNVGMNSTDIRRSINAQMVIVFFAPVIMAGIHMAFAFPIVNKLLIMFGLYNVKLLALTTIGTGIIFAIIYLIIYRITSNTYFKIVNTAER